MSVFGGHSQKHRSGNEIDGKGEAVGRRAATAIYILNRAPRQPLPIGTLSDEAGRRDYLEGQWNSQNPTDKQSARLLGTVPELTEDCSNWTPRFSTSWMRGTNSKRNGLLTRRLGRCTGYALPLFTTRYTVAYDAALGCTSQKRSRLDAIRKGAHN